MKTNTCLMTEIENPKGIQSAKAAWHQSVELSVSLLIWLAALEAGHAALSVIPASSHSMSNAVASGGSYLPAFSADGQHLVFISYANNLVTNDDLGPNLDVFVSDLANGIITLISVNTNGVGGGNADALLPSISSNGQFVAFASFASNLVPDDTNQATDVFLRDLSAATTELISVDLEGRSPPNIYRYTTNGLSGNPRVSADGRWVFFDSAASNLVALADDNQTTDVFARDRQTGTTILVSVNTNGTASANGTSQLSDITPDGRLAVFISTATDLAPGGSNRVVEVYVRDLSEGSTICASDSQPTNVASDGRDYVCRSAAITPDGRFVAYLVSDAVVVRRGLRGIGSDERLAGGVRIPRRLTPLAKSRWPLCSL